MKRFDYTDFLVIDLNEVLKIKIKDKDGYLFVNRVSQSVLQSFQPASTPITKINFEIIKDLALHQSDKNEEDNVFELIVEPENVIDFELIRI